MKIKAANLDDAMQYAMEANLPAGNYVDNSFDVHKENSKEVTE